MSPETKHANFEIAPEQHARLDALKQALKAPSLEVAVLRSSALTLLLARALTDGKHLYLGERRETAVRLELPELESLTPEWRWLVARPHPWRRQLWIKGRRLLASQVWKDMRVNALSAEQVAEDLNLPVEAIDEVVSYCESSAALIALEADEEQQRLGEAGVSLAPVA